MQLEVGKILDGKVTGITKFGAFIELDEGKTGMVHISEISSTYVNDISEHLQVGQEVKVKVLKVEDNKISLSIKRAQEAEGHNKSGFSRRNQEGSRNSNYKKDRPAASKPSYYEWNPPAPKSDPVTFEDMMTKFKQRSDERMSDLKKNVDGKRGSYSRRSTSKTK